MLLHEGGQNSILPDLQIVVAPTLDGEVDFPRAQTLPMPARETSPNRNVTNLLNMGSVIIGICPARNNDQVTNYGDRRERA